MTKKRESEAICLLSREGRRRRLRALLVKEMLQIIKDPSSILISVVLPVLLLFLYGTGVSLDLDHLKVGLVLEDSAPDVQSFAKALTDSRYFDVTLKRDPRELREDLEKGAIRGMLVVPSYFSDFRKRPSKIAPIQVIADGSETNTAHFVQNYASGAFQKWLIQQRIDGNMPNPIPPLKVENRYWFNEKLESRYFLLPGSLAIIMTLIGTLLTSLVVSREWERGTMEGLMATPVSIIEFVLSKLISYFILGMISMILCVAISLLIYQIPFKGSFLALAVISSLFLLSSLGSGLLISSYCKNQIVASQASLVVGFMPSYILSGFIFEISSMPLPIQWITYAIPARYFVTCLQSIFLVGDVWPLFVKNLIPIVFIGLLLFVMTALKIVKRLD